MPQLLILEPCLVNFNDGNGGVPTAAGALPTVDSDTAALLVKIGRALYTKKADDFDKSGANTAPAEIVEQARRALADADKATAKVSKAEEKAEA